YHVLADRTRPMDFEIHSISNVEGFGDRQEPEQRFLPFYGGDARTWHSRQAACYTVRREPRLLSTRQRRDGARSSYVGSELFLSLVDGQDQPLATGLRQVGMRLLCTNRDLPLHMPVGKSKTDFTIDADLPVEQARCIVGPTRPRASTASGETAWRLLSHLQFEATAQRQIDGIKSLASRPILRRNPIDGPITYGRGLEVALTCDGGAFEGTGAYLLGAVMQHFFSRYASVKSFTETVVRTLERNEGARRPTRLGTRRSP